MFLLRILIERILAILFGLIGTIAGFQGLAMLIAVAVWFVMPGRSEAPSWLTTAILQTAFLSALFLVCGWMLSGLKARHTRKASWRDVDESLPREWIWPATIPTLALPVFALSQSQGLILLWSDILPFLERISPADFTRGPGGWILLPILAVLFVPLLEVVAALFLIAIPPLLLVLLATRSLSFRLNCQRTAVAQATLVAASLLGAHLFGRFADLAIPPIHAEGGAEATLVVDALTRGREVLWGTAVAYAMVVAGTIASLWMLMAAQVEQPLEREVIGR